MEITTLKDVQKILFDFYSQTDIPDIQKELFLNEIMTDIKDRFLLEYFLEEFGNVNKYKISPSNVHIIKSKVSKSREKRKRTVSIRRKMEIARAERKIKLKMQSNEKVSKKKKSLYDDKKAHKKISTSFRPQNAITTHSSLWTVNKR